MLHWRNLLTVLNTAPVAAITTRRLALILIPPHLPLTKLLPQRQVPRVHNGREMNPVVEILLGAILAWRLGAQDSCIGLHATVHYGLRATVHYGLLAMVHYGLRATVHYGRLLLVVELVKPVVIFPAVAVGGGRRSPAAVNLEHLDDGKGVEAPVDGAFGDRDVDTGHCRVTDRGW